MKRALPFVLILVVLFGIITVFVLRNRATSQAEVARLRNRVADRDALKVEPAATHETEEAEEDEEPTPPELTAEEILALAEARWETIDDYHCTTIAFTRNGDETKDQVLDNIFKKPALYRTVEIEGPNAGSTVTYNAEGVIHGQRGGLLAGLVLELEPDDERIRSLRGRRFFETAWGLEFEEAREAVASGGELVRLDDQELDGTMCYVIAVNSEPDQSGLTEQQFWIDRETHLLRRRLDFEGDTVVRDAKFINVELNVNPDESIFSQK